MRIGEIIETGTTGFVAESFTLHRPPPLGSLVKVEVASQPRIYGVVSHGTTTSPEPGRRAVRRSNEEVYDEAIYEAHPQLKRVLRTEFTVLLVGCVENGQIRHHLPPQPPPLHHSVHQCTADELRAFTEQRYYLRLLLSADSPVPIEQLIAAHVREAYRQRGNDAQWLEATARELASLLKNDYERLMTLLYAVEPGGEA